MSGAWFKTRCDGSMQDFYSYASKVPPPEGDNPDAEGYAFCPECWKRVQLVADLRGIRRRIPAHNIDYARLAFRECLMSLSTQNSVPAVTPSPAKAKGAAAYVQLYSLAWGKDSQSLAVARFLLNLHNGDAYPFDLGDFRLLKAEVFRLCMDVLEIDRDPDGELERYIADGRALLERLAENWRLRDFSRETDGTWKQFIWS